MKKKIFKTIAKEFLKAIELHESQFLYYKNIDKFK